MPSCEHKFSRYCHVSMTLITQLCLSYEEKYIRIKHDLFFSILNAIFDAT